MAIVRPFVCVRPEAGKADKVADFPMMCITGRKHVRL